MKAVIIEMMQEIADMLSTEIVSDLNDETLLLESGLDSLGFAMLVARLEEELGYDPFSIMETPVYPRTLKEFVHIYETVKP